MKNTPTRHAALESALAKIEEICDRKVARFGSDLESNYTLVPTGLTALDMLLGTSSPTIVRGTIVRGKVKSGGIVKGGITEIYGPESVGKTNLALQMIVAAQKRGELCCFIDLGRSFSKFSAVALGVDVENLIIAAPMSLEEALKVIQTLLESDALGLCVIDALGALQPHTLGNVRGLPKTKSSLITQVIKNIDLLAAKSGTACVITRRMNPSFARSVAGDSAIHKASKTTIELIASCRNVDNFAGPRTLRLHKHVPSNFLAENGVEPLVMTL